ncbi:RNA pseudouridine synthase [Amylibacter ulvae]|uniref:Pseudouridine synthase n=1 Tax=Paramylibacter ulvae TaxID=1651968 RepID=A0ABQ3D722_9RHOB|nr:RluA family pseudouridine synthase [Amylibacter ulvae]GHA59495.1 RNA pseudouridine synthase [Amylibacter ulvae]
MEKLNYQPSTAPLCILFEDADLLVVDKPSGLLSVPGKAAEHADCLETRLRDEYPDALLVHRLDMDTSGVMVFARNKPAQRHLGLQFEKRQMRKTYHAIVAGLVQGETGLIDLPLIVDWPNRPLQKVDFKMGKPAQTEWRVLSRNHNSTYVELSPKTGRSHQLRVHMLAIGHPILGDRFYGDARVVASMDRLALHASMLRFRHPTGGAWCEFTAKVPF